jgi:hypothetical protein
MSCCTCRLNTIQDQACLRSLNSQETDALTLFVDRNMAPSPQGVPHNPPPSQTASQTKSMNETDELEDMSWDV